VVDFIFVHWKAQLFPGVQRRRLAITSGAIMMMIDVLFLDREGSRHADPAG
jgi:hypothetical protein